MKNIKRGQTMYLRPDEGCAPVEISHTQHSYHWRTMSGGQGCCELTEADERLFFSVDESMAAYQASLDRRRSDIEEAERQLASDKECFLAVKMNQMCPGTFTQAHWLLLERLVKAGEAGLSYDYAEPWDKLLMSQLINAQLADKWASFPGAVCNVNEEGAKYYTSHRLWNFDSDPKALRTLLKTDAVGGEK